ncbi:ATP-binding protein [Rubrivirga sp. IMCC43871]|uniref:GAF domain-containing sensor histidine kinase n=1 Tax=Rubrivirga sp. IMCC43871 TaxID=3391575 RepID=UPI00398FAAF9
MPPRTPRMVLTETRPLARPSEAPAVTLARLRRLLDVSVALNALGDTDHLLRFIASTTTEVLACEAASILLFDETTGALRFTAATGEAGAQLVGEEVPLRGSLAGTTFLEDRILHAADAGADARRHRAADEATGFETRALLGVPMRVDGRPVGVLQALNPHAAAFDRADAEALLIIASQAAVAIRNARHEAALQRANDRMAGLDRLKSNFMAIASHELRTPITAVHGFGQILTEELRGDLYSHADAIVRAGDRMMDVVETLDVMAGLDEDLGIHPGTLTSLASILGEAADHAAPGASVSLPDGPLLVEGHGHRLRLAFSNVLRNAVQFSSGGPVRLAAEVAHGEVHVAVSDHGRGLAAGDLERVFEPYHQVADPDSRDHEGLGVGLTVARAVMIQHGGRLWIESAGPGQGCTVRARLPLAAAA